jgi:nitrate/nitrite transporter NarK
MNQQRITRNWTEKGSYTTMPIDIRLVEASTIKPEEANIGDLMGNLDEHNAQKGYIHFLLPLVIGMILQVTGSTFCVLAGTLVCVSVCGLICFWVCYSAVFSRKESNSLSPSTT